MLYNRAAMPIYEYEAKELKRGCDHCESGFQVLQRISDDALEACPECGCELIKLISAPSVGESKSGLDDRAKGAGFQKYKRLGKGEYEKQY